MSEREYLELANHSDNCWRVLLQVIHRQLISKYDMNPQLAGQITDCIKYIKSFPFDGLIVLRFFDFEIEETVSNAYEIGIVYESFFEFFMIHFDTIYWTFYE